ncbi:MAG: hypothetical protein Q7R34_11870 [Dehalococcoidia bacterium]|nr:hypothetical protein [Dehalococcoidia bacterium]
MLRGLLVSLLFIGLAIYSLSNSTMAVFTDNETASGTFAVGTMDFRYRVSQDGGLHWGAWQNGSSASFNLPRLRRGQNGTVIYQIENLGTVDALLDLRNVVVVDYENGCKKREKKVDTTCDNPGAGQGELGATLLVTVMMGNTPVYNGPLNGFSGDYNINKPLPGNSTIEVEMTIDWFLPSLLSGLGNVNDDDDDDDENDDDDGHARDIIEGDSTAVSFRFELIQA